MGCSEAPRGRTIPVGVKFLEPARTGVHYVAAPPPAHCRAATTRLELRAGDKEGTSTAIIAPTGSACLRRTSATGSRARRWRGAATRRTALTPTDRAGASIAPAARNSAAADPSTVTSRRRRCRLHRYRSPMGVQICLGLSSRARTATLAGMPISRARQLGGL